MLVKIDQFGGLVPKIIDPVLIPINKAQTAINCRFDLGGVAPLNQDQFEEVLSGNNAPVSLFNYWNGNNRYFFTWDTDVDAVKTPIPNDSYNRVFFTEGGILKVTDGNLFNANNATVYPSEFRLPCPPQPVNPINPVLKAADPPIGSLLTDGNNNAMASNNTGGHTSNLACDGNPLTWWQSDNMAYITGSQYVINTNNGNNLCWWQYDLGNNVAYAINHLDITYSNATGANIQLCGPGAFVVQGSNDGNNWTDLFQKGGLTEAIWLAAANNTLSWDWNPQVDSNNNIIKHRYARLLITTATKLLNSSNKKMTLMDVVMTYIPGQPDPTLKETRAYTYTFVNTYGEEGPPAEVPQASLIDCFDGDTIYLDGMDANLATGNNGTPNPNIPAGISNLAGNNISTLETLFDITKINVYRTQQTAAGSSQFQLVEQISYPPTPDSSGHQLTDQLKDASLSLVLPSADWDIAPDGIKGLISLPNGVTAGFVGNLICLSVPYFPHAWPTTQQYACDRDIVGIGSFGTTIVALTAGNPWALIGNDPSNMVMEKLNSIFSCLSKKGVVSISNIVVYPSPEGLVGIGPNGVELLTSDIMTRDHWNSQYTPSSIVAFHWEGKYVAFFENPSGFKAGFMFDPRTKDLVDLDFFIATGGFYDSTDGTLYLVIRSDGSSVAWENYAGNSVTWTNSGNNTVSWQSGGVFIVAFARAPSYRLMYWSPKRFKFRANSIGIMRVVGQFPVGVNVQSNGYGKIFSVKNGLPVRLPSGLIEYFDITFSGTKPISAIYVATSMQELPL